MSRTGEQGFTLLELLVVLTLVGVMVAIVPPMLDRGTDRARLTADGRRLLDSLNFAHEQAIVEAKPIPFPLDVVTRQYGLAGHPDHFDKGITVSVDAATIEGQSDHQALILFFPDGSSSGGRIRLANPAGVLDIAVDWLTGRSQLDPAHAG